MQNEHKGNIKVLNS